MIDFKSVLGTLMESGLAPSASQRIGNAYGQPRQGGGDLGSVLSGVLGSARQAAGDTKREAQAGNPMAVGGLGALAGAVLGGLRGSPARGALGGAALAVLGQIAAQALQKNMGGGAAAAPAQPEGRPAAAGHQPAAPAAPSAPLPTAPGDGGQDDDARAELLLKAMINAAKADGQIDGTEMNAILAKLDESGTGPEARDFVLAEMRRPLDVDGLVAAAATPDLAAAVYAASAMAIRVDTPAERSYLAQLAARLRLSPAVRASLDASLGVGRGAATA